MHALRRLAASLFCFVLFVGMLQQATAQDGGTTIAVVDVQRLLRESLAGQSIETQMQQFRTLLDEQITQKEATLRDERQQLNEQASLLSPEVLAERRRAFDEKVRALQREVRDRRLEVEQSYAEAISEVRQSVIDILQAFIEQRGIGVVLTRSSYLASSPNLDLTDDVLKELNLVLPSLSINLGSGG